ncbi:MAG TPA: Gfo/Idh/MocA family oxidoreductase [Pyrinomonadaceae bacterium]|nr:Gfo/Idh/MocA family oxidoreductase [Pyrinomonadaceae bacterium]
MTRNNLVLAQIGCGYWGPNLLRNFSAQKDCWVKLVVDQSAERRAYVEANFPKSQTSAVIDAALADTEIDAVVIATPAGSHYELVKAFLAAGKHVFVEKPLATNSADADDLIKLSERAGKVLMAGHTFLFNPAVRYVKQVLDRGDLGDTYYIYSQRLNLGQVRSDVNAWWNLAPHDVSILLYLMNGELPVSVVGWGLDYIQLGIEDVVFATLTWANRMMAHIQVSWLDPGRVRRMTFVGSRKMIVYDDVSDDKIAIFDKGIDRVPLAGERMDFDNFNNYQLFHRTGDVLLPKIQFQEPLKLESAHFLECLREGAAPLTGPKHARDVVAVLEAVDRSIRSKRPIDVA